MFSAPGRPLLSLIWPGAAPSRGVNVQNWKPWQAVFLVQACAAACAGHKHK
jgi:hypothetical protein